MKKSNIIGLSVGIVIVIVVVSLIGWFAIKPVPNIIQGEVEAQSYKISSKLAGRIEKMDVTEGQKVSKGEQLFILSTPEIQAKLEQAKAVKEAASAQSNKVEAGARVQEIEAAYNMWQTTMAALELAKKEYQRASNLYDAGVIPKQKFDQAEAALQVTKSTSAAARDQYQMIQEGARPEDKRAALALVAQASGGVAEVQSYMNDAIQYSPIDGEVSTIIAEQEELIGSGYPVITLLDMKDMWITFNIKEDMLPKIKIGTEMMGYVPGLGRSIPLKVYFMAVQADYATWSATRTRGEFDIRTFEVKARPEGTIEGLRPGMTVAVNWDDLK